MRGKTPSTPSDHDAVGLCRSCRSARSIVTAKGSVFWLCRHEALPRYPRLPVLGCVEYEARTAGREDSPA